MIFQGKQINGALLKQWREEQAHLSLEEFVAEINVEKGQSRITSKTLQRIELGKTASTRAQTYAQIYETYLKLEQKRKNQNSSFKVPLVLVHK